MSHAKRNIAAISIVALSALAAVSEFDLRPILVWNASASAPIGLYRIESGLPDIGDYALISPDEQLETFIAGRGYLPENIPLLKRVAALSGDEICRKSEAIFINETYVAEARISDSFGRELPQWSGCVTLQPDELFLLNDHERSLDGRYFGATKADEVIGVARPLWIREAVQ